MTIKLLLLWVFVLGEAVAIGLLGEPIAGVLFIGVLVFGLLVLEVVDRRV